MRCLSWGFGVQKLSSGIPVQRTMATVLLLAAVLLGCTQSIKLAQAPTLYSVGEDYPGIEVPQALQSVDPSILYVTDRLPEFKGSGLSGYGYERSASMVLGAAKVRFGRFDTWAQLVARSETHDRMTEVLTVGDYNELVRFPETPLPFETQGGVTRPKPAAMAIYAADTVAFQREVTARMRLSPRREVVLFVHGFNSDIEDALTTTASLWHYAGRIGVPISFSWPAGNPGLTSYLKDRESGEYSVFHLKETLRILAAILELQAIHVVAHSRGADVATSALRELTIAELAAGRDPRRTLKIDTFILAAPDLDFGVVRQRLVAEGTAAAVGQANIYLNPRDGALGIAQVIAAGMRLGRLAPDKLTEQEWGQLAELKNVHFINVESAGGKIGHVYFRDNPAVLSDVILALRTAALPGEPSRPLELVRSNFWNLHANYPGERVVPEYVSNIDR